MIQKILMISAIVVISGMFSPALLACSAMGSTTHAGKVLSIDEDKSTFTILDMETLSPITFHADQAIMQQIMAAEGTAIVDFTGEGTSLTATGVRSP